MYCPVPVEGTLGAGKAAPILDRRGVLQDTMHPGVEWATETWVLSVSTPHQATAKKAH